MSRLTLRWLPFCVWMMVAPVAAAPLVLLTEENPPFNYVEGGRVTGIATEVVLAMAQRAAIPVAVEMLPWARAYTRAQSERDTCLFATARLDNRERLFAWVGPLASNLWAVYGRGDFAGTIRTLADLKAYRIGGVTADAKADYLRENGVTNVRTAAEDRANPSRLFLPRDHLDHIDLWITGLYGARAVASAAKVNDVKLVFVVREIPLFLACSPRTAPETVKALGAALDALKAEGLPAKIAAEFEKKFGR